MVENNDPSNAEPPEKLLGGITGKGFMPGQSGNPGGRAKTASLSKAYREELEKPFPNDPAGRTYAQVIAAKQVEDAAAGNLLAAREIADRAEGKPQQAVKLDVRQRQLEEMSQEELRQYAETGQLPAWAEGDGERDADGSETPDA